MIRAKQITIGLFVGTLLIIFIGIALICSMVAAVAAMDTIHAFQLVN